ncbi:restriction endonuclease subunit S [Bowmanella sp. Y26]|uniref:restriction endonuclease subunit S n=1 Tax=Bowmanella yangjiangensis TaxID=2811230 RepID=UPI001BDC0D01|nr:restriction endonuclease subunit S [Bowmanella yangjiangensis]MBT1063725.1 restriction endonuclease subunit S [Bowmanella yangjiangensis]
MDPMPKYEYYKDSGVDWLGKLPSHWLIIRMKFLYKDFSLKNKPTETLLSVTQDRGVVPRDWVENRMVMPSGNLESFKFIEKGDFAISLRSFEGGLEYCHHDGIISPAYTVLKSTKDFLHDRYYKYLFKSQIFISELQTSIVGIREGKNISYEELRYSFLPIPDEVEQIYISNYLDQKTAQIDEAIAIKEQQIALLKERKQIIIQQAVTQGLDPNVPMKDSGVDWIGKIPEHWNIKPLTKEVFVQEGPGIMAVDFHESGVPLVRISGVKSDLVSLEGCNYLKPSKVRQKWNHFRLNQGDLVISGSASTELVSEVGKEAEGAILYTGLIRVTPQRKSVLKDYLKIFLGTKLFFTQIDLQKTGSTISHYGPSHLSKMFVLLPSLSEQIEIARFVNSASRKLDEAIMLQQSQIEKLKEYKATLINSAVTGKIKVA